MLRFLLPIQSFIVLMGFVSLLDTPGLKLCKKVVLVNFYLAPRQKKDKLEKSPKHFKTKQSSNWNYNCTKKMVSDFWFDWLVFNVYFLTILKVFYFTLNFNFHQKTCSDWVKNSWKFGNLKFVRPFGEQVILQKLFVQKLFLSTLVLLYFIFQLFDLKNILAERSVLTRVNFGKIQLPSLWNFFSYNGPLW